MLVPLMQQLQVVQVEEAMENVMHPQVQVIHHQFHLHKEITVEQDNQ